MVVRTLAAAAVIFALGSPSAGAAEEPKQETRTFDARFLYEYPDGGVWVGKPLVYLGMVGVAAHAPVYRLSPTLAQQYAPLVNRIENPPRQPEFYWVQEMPFAAEETQRLADRKRPLVLMRMAANVSLIHRGRVPAPPSERPSAAAP